MTKIGQANCHEAVIVNVGKAKTDLSKLLARAEAGEEIEIARDGVPVARLVRIPPDDRPGPRFFAAHGSLAGLRVLGFAPEHGLGVADLPLHHRDPFDRLLIAQARRERLGIVTADRRFRDYEADVVDASR